MNKESIFIKTNPNNIAFINWVFEGFEYLGIVSTLDRKEGRLVIRTTPDMFDDAYKVIKNFTFHIEILEN